MLKLNVKIMITRKGKKMWNEGPLYAGANLSAIVRRHSDIARKRVISSKDG